MDLTDGMEACCCPGSDGVRLRSEAASFTVSSEVGSCESTILDELKSGVLMEVEHLRNTVQQLVELRAGRTLLLYRQIGPLGHLRLESTYDRAALQCICAYPSRSILIRLLSTLCTASTITTREADHLSATSLKSESHVPRQPESEAVHLLVWRHAPHEVKTITIGIWRNLSPEVTACSLILVSLTF